MMTSCIVQIFGRAASKGLSFAMQKDCKKKHFRDLMVMTNGPDKSQLHLWIAEVFVIILCFSWHDRLGGNRINIKNMKLIYALPLLLLFCNIILFYWYFLKGLEHVSCEDWLRELGMFSMGEA